MITVVLTFTIYLSVIIGILNAMTKISNTRNGVLPQAKQYNNTLGYIFRDHNE